jgi:hypothetical protein
MGLAVREAKEVLMLEKGKGPWHKNIVIIKLILIFPKLPFLDIY